MRIHITGNAGSGKTTLARELGEILNIRVFGLDKIVWKEGWAETPKEERALIEEQLTSKQDWIIEGVSSKAREKSDFVIFLDVPLHTCLRRGVLRSFKYLFATRPELPNNCPEIRMIHRLVKLIFQFNRTMRPIIINDINVRSSVTIANRNQLYGFVESYKK